MMSAMAESKPVDVTAGVHTPNLGVHLANRLVEVGCTTAFAVPGDFNLLLLDQLLKQPKLDMVWCCNELNAGYAADGYARKMGIGCVVVTFCVGGFSVLNAIAGCMSEDLPIIVISGTPNSNDYGQNRVLHHTVGLADFNQQLRAFKEVTCCQVTINHLEDAARAVDTAISAALAHRKPVYIEVSCNLADLTHPSFTRPSVPYQLPQTHTNEVSLNAAVEAALEVLNHAVKPVMLGGPRLRYGQTRSQFVALAEKAKYPFAILPDAKGMVPEDHPQYIGLYWGAVSSPCACEVIESADVVITVGAVWTDYSTVGYSLLLNPNKVIKVADRSVTICGGVSFGCIAAESFLKALSAKIAVNSTAHDNFMRMYVPPSQPLRQPAGAPLVITVMFKHIQAMLTPEMAVISEVGDSWFNSQKLKLPRGTEYEMQMRYGSIGWSVGCVLGYSKAAQKGALPRPNSALTVQPPGPVESHPVGALQSHPYSGAVIGGPKRVVAFIGDGSFQMTAQEVSTMIRYNLNPIIFLINNGGYTIEVEIHDGPYNVIKNWDYTAFVSAMRNDEGKLWTAKVRTEEELEVAIAAATSAEHADDLCFIEVFTHREDCSKELLEWGSRVAAANSRAPQPAK